MSMSVGLTMPGSLAHSVTSNPSATFIDFTVSSGVIWATARPQKLKAATSAARAQVIRREMTGGRSMVGCSAGAGNAIYDPLEGADKLAAMHVNSNAGGAR